MRIIRIDKNNQVNGDGLRCVIWYAGCAHCCSGCHNPETWDFNCGHNVTIEDLNVIYDQLERDEIAGLTLTGGDPLYQDKDIAPFLRQVKYNFPDKDIWCYTGFLYDDVKHYECMKYIDVLVEGLYIAELNPGPGKVLWRGSTNQRIIDVKQTRENNEITLYAQ